MYNLKNSEGEVLEGDYTATDMPIVYENKVRQMGTAVFKADKMVGELTGRETFYYLMVSGKLGRRIIHCPILVKGQKYYRKREYITLRLGRQET